MLAGSAMPSNGSTVKRNRLARSLSTASDLDTVTRFSATRYRMAASLLVIDLGKTSCRAALWVGSSRTDARGAGARGLAAPDGAGLAEAAILAVAIPLLRAAGLPRLEAVGVGAAGALAAPKAAQRLAAHLCTSLPARRVAVASDATMSHAGALAGEPGVVLAVGTGAVAVAVGSDSALYRADGWGPWLGDEGGGAWLGLRGLRAVLRAADGRGPATALQAAAAARFGPLPELVAQIEGHENPPRLAASFAGDMAHAAQAGDMVAAALIRQAAAMLADAVRAAAARLTGAGPISTAVVGGLMRLGPIFTDPLFAALDGSKPALSRVAARGTALDGARLLALRGDTIHEGHVVREAAL